MLARGKEKKKNCSLGNNSDYSHIRKSLGCVSSKAPNAVEVLWFCWGKKNDDFGDRNLIPVLFTGCFRILRSLLLSGKLDFTPNTSTLSDTCTGLGMRMITLSTSFFHRRLGFSRSVLPMEDLPDTPRTPALGH